jgi:hypothetical protein
MRFSDLSQNPIEGDAPATVICEFEDGQRRKLTVTTQELDALLNRGTDVTRPWARIGRWSARVVRKALPWAAGILLGSLAIPAITKQWSDRQGALAIKQQVVTSLTRDAVAAYRIGYRRAQAGRSNTTADNTFQRALDAISRERSATDGLVFTYFRGRETERAWVSYRDIWYYYALLGSPFAADRAGAVETLRGYYEEHYVGTSGVTESDWKILDCAEQTCDVASSEFLARYQELADELFQARWDISSVVLEDEVSGFSRGWEDLIRDTFEPLVP